MTELDEEYRPRLTFNCTDEQFRKLQELIPWGLKKAIFQKVAQDVIDGVEKLGNIFIAGALDGRLRYGLHEDDKAVANMPNLAGKKQKNNKQKEDRK